MNELDKIEINDVDGMEKLKKNKQNTQCEISCDRCIIKVENFFLYIFCCGPF